MAAAAAATALSCSFSSLYFPNFSCRNLRTISIVKASISTSTEFNITFGVKKKETYNPKPIDSQKSIAYNEPKPVNSQKSVAYSESKQVHSQKSVAVEEPNTNISAEPVPVFIPWIVRDENGNLKLQSHPPAHILNAMAEAKTAKKKGSKKVNSVKTEPKHSKAARRFYNEKFREPQRLSKVLAAAGVASRRSSEELIFEGRVTVNGSMCNSPQTRVDPLKDTIYVNGSRLPKKLPPKVYFALNKPKGYICSSGEESKSVLSLFDDYWKSWKKTNPGTPKPRLFTVGRLDVATSGLIIVTNDGDFAQGLAHPSSKLAKEYIATIESSVNRRHLNAVSEGTSIEGIHCKPDSVEVLPPQPDISRPRLRIVVHEGRNHEVRELVKNAGLQLHSLKRVRIGGFRLPSDLGLGKHLELKDSDLNLLGWKAKRNA